MELDRKLLSKFNLNVKTRFEMRFKSGVDFKSESKLQKRFRNEAQFRDGLKLEQKTERREGKREIK